LEREKIALVQLDAAGSEEPKGSEQRFSEETISVRIVKVEARAAGSGVGTPTPAGGRPGGRPIDIGSACQAEDLLAVEEPLEIRLGFGPHASRQHQTISLTMRTPGNDRELAAGFLLTEGIVRSREELAEVCSCGPFLPPGNHQNVVRVELEPEVEVDLGRLQRHFYTTSSCGVCGKTSLEALSVAVDRQAIVSDFEVRAETLVGLPETLRAAQAVFGRTGGLHAAALFDRDGRLLCAREDVGRHNALDKLIGVQLMEGRLPLEQRILLLSGRASFELLQKAFVAGAPLVAAVGAPSSLALELAERFGITLVGWLRGGRFSIYSHPGRIRLE
jgi:FdhD protein